MSIKRVALCTSALLFALTLASGAQAKKFSLIGGGGQGHIGNGLMLPVQAAATAATTTTMFPNLRVPAVGGIIDATTAKTTLLTTPMGKSGYQQAITNVPVGVLSKPASPTTVGVKFSNPTVFAVATNMNYVWPAAPAAFGTGVPLGAPSILFGGGSLTYSNALGSRFGGPAQFALSSGGANGLLAAPVTVYIKINASTPPCVGCLAGLIGAVPAPALFGPGGATATTVTTPGVPIAGMNIAVVNMGATPLGTIVPPAPFLAATGAIPTNMATSQPGPWTTGQVIISHPLAGGAGEKFTLSGRDDRTVGGRGTIQMVSGALSARVASGPNANRGWVQLKLNTVGTTPAMSPLAQGSVAGLMLLAGGYMLRRRLSSTRASA